MLAHWRKTSAALRQSEKMAQLGTLTAGVAHELNNPAAAVKRGAEQLTEAVTTLLQAQAQVDRLGLDAAQRQPCLRWATQSAQPRPSQGPRWTPWRATIVSSSWRAGWTIAGYRMPGSCRRPSWSSATTQEKLAALVEPFAPEQLPGVVSWLGATYSAHNLLAEVGQGAGRISEIVKALKSYAYLDQAPVQSVDFHQGLDNTLLILRHKLSGIRVRREYAPELPAIQGYGSELNQVWTNLIDNAVDALENTASPEIILRTRTTADWVTVEVQDNGPGIPPEIQSRIFDAFFTTKPPGKGTGLGLEISYSIVVNKHRGNVKVFSQPGFTCFQVILPLNFEAVDTMTQPVPAVAKGDDDQMRRILESAKTIAVVGMSLKTGAPVQQRAGLFTGAWLSHYPGEPKPRSGAGRAGLSRFAVSAGASRCGGDLPAERGRAADRRAGDPGRRQGDLDAGGDCQRGSGRPGAACGPGCRDGCLHARDA